MKTQQIKLISVLEEKKITALFNAISSVDDEIPAVSFEHAKDLDEVSSELNSDLYEGVLCPNHFSNKIEELSERLESAGVEDSFKVFFLPEGCDLDTLSVVEVRDTILEMLEGMDIALEVEKKEPM